MNENMNEQFTRFLKVARPQQSERQVRRLRESGELVGFTIGRRRMYLQSEVDEFIERSKKQGKSNK